MLDYIHNQKNTILKVVAVVATVFFCVNAPVYALIAILNDS